MAPNGHSTVGASTCERWWNCPGSCALCAKLPPADTTRYAAEGTAAHWLCEHVLTNKIAYNAQWDATHMIGEPIEGDDMQFTVTEEMADAVNLYVDTILEDIKRIGCTLRGSLEVEGKDSWQHWDKKTQERPNQNWVNIEKGFELKDVDTEARGTNDASIYRPGETLIVYDFKYGQGIAVEAQENKQMLYYAIGAAGNNLMKFKSIELVIIQPRAQHPQGPVRRWITTPEYVAQFKKELREHIAETRNPNAITKTGKWCRFCNAKMICPAMRDKSYEVAKIDFAQAPEKNILKTPDQLSKEELKLFLDNVDLLENYIAQVKAYAFKVLDNGGNIDGYKLVRSGKAHRKWNGADEDVASMLEMELGLTHDDLYTSSLKTPAQVEKLFKGAAKKSAIEVVSAYSFKPEGELKLVREDDLREKQLPSAITDFQNVNTLESLGI